MLVDALLVQLVGIGLVGTEDDGAVLPFPEAERGPALSFRDFVEEDFIEGNVYWGR